MGAIGFLPSWETPTGVSQEENMLNCIMGNKGFSVCGAFGRKSQNAFAYLCTHFMSEQADKELRETSPRVFPLDGPHGSRVGVCSSGLITRYILKSSTTLVSGNMAYSQNFCQSVFCFLPKLFSMFCANRHNSLLACATKFCSAFCSVYLHFLRCFAHSANLEQDSCGCPLYSV